MTSAQPLIKCTSQNNLACKVARRSSHWGRFYGTSCRSSLTLLSPFTYLEWKYKLEIVTCNALKFCTYFVIHAYMTSDNTSWKIFNRGEPRHKHKISRMCVVHSWSVVVLVMYIYLSFAGQNHRFQFVDYFPWESVETACLGTRHHTPVTTSAISYLNVASIGVNCQTASDHYKLFYFSLLQLLPAAATLSS